MLKQEVSSSRTTFHSILISETSQRIVIKFAIGDIYKIVGRI